MVKKQIIHVDEYSKVPIFLEILCNEHKLGIATGFVYKHGDRLFLITNWHVVTGRNPTSKNLINPQLMKPTHLVAWFHKPVSTEKLTWQPRICKLYNEMGEPEWFEHPLHHSNVDVAVIAIDDIGDNRFFPINDIEQTEFRVQVSQEVFVLGFPRGIAGAGKLPIWKRGSIASEPSANLDNLPKYLIDTATREGMSGSPVIVRYTGMYQRDPGKLSGDDWFGQGTQFFGIYSGRNIERSDELAAQLGIVWKSESLLQVLEGISPPKTEGNQ